MRFAKGRIGRRFGSSCGPREVTATVGFPFPGVTATGASHACAERPEQGERARDGRSAEAAPKPDRRVDFDLDRHPCVLRL
jgi:hypothetical protein